MSHLGDRLSALVDGELGGAERDRAHAHLAACEQCRTEAAELRALKQKLRGLMDGAPAEAAMTSRLIAMTGPGGPMPPRRRLLRVVPARRPGGPAPGPGRQGLVTRRLKRAGEAGVISVTGCPPWSTATSAEPYSFVLTRTWPAASSAVPKPPSSGSSSRSCVS